MVIEREREREIKREEREQSEDKVFEVKCRTSLSLI